MMQTSYMYIPPVQPPNIDRLSHDICKQKCTYTKILYRLMQNLTLGGLKYIATLQRVVLYNVAQLTWPERNVLKLRPYVNSR